MSVSISISLSITMSISVSSISISVVGFLGCKQPEESDPQAQSPACDRHLGCLGLPTYLNQPEPSLFGRIPMHSIQGFRYRA